MLRGLLAGFFLIPIACCAQSAPAFEVATVRPVTPELKSGRYIKVDGVNRFVAKNFTLKLLIAAAYDLNEKAISGGPSWIQDAKFDINAITPGDVRPTRDQQMAMLRTLLTDRFKLVFHREPKQFSIYVLTVAKGGPRLKDSGASATDSSSLISTVYPQHILMPARNASMQDFTAVLQRAILDRPVVNRTGLTGRYDFDLDWAPDETQFGGEIPAAPADGYSLPLLLALQRELGLKLEATRGTADALVISQAQKPVAN